MTRLLHDRLPGHLADDPFLARFLGIFEHQGEILRHRVDTLEHVIDPAVAPDALVRWLGTWLGLHEIDPTMDHDRQRRIVQTAGRTLTQRGTAAAVAELLHSMTGGLVGVTDNGGVRTAGAPVPDSPIVWIDLEGAGELTDEDVLAVVRRELPVSVSFELQVAGRVIHPEGARWTGPKSSNPKRRRREPLRGKPASKPKGRRGNR